MGDSVVLAESLVDVLGNEPGVLLTIGSDRLTVRLIRDGWQLDEHHVELARAVSAVARAHAAFPEKAAFKSCSRRSRPNPKR